MESQVLTEEAPAAIAQPQAAAEPQLTFADLGLDPKLLTVLTKSGYTSPTPIQQKAIPAALQGRDVLGIAQTGTGKTAAFSLPMIQRLSKGRARAGMPRSLILAPTRELADQVAEQIKKYAADFKLKMVLLIGGVSMGDQDRALQAGVDIIIATPGRLLDLFDRGKVRLFGIEVMVVDEADRMLDMGFIPDVERIFKLTPFTRQTLFFSATMPKEIQHLVDQFLQGAVRVEASRPATTATTITQRLVRVREKEPKAKRAALRAAIDALDVKNAIVFCNRKREVDLIAKSLARHGYSASPIHGDLPQSERMATLRRFRDGELRILVASDVAARGLDIPEVTHVFNFDPPNSPDDYVHRIGRTGRAGRKGASVTLAGPEDGKKLKAVEDMLGAPIPPLDLSDASKADSAIAPDAETAPRETQTAPETVVAPEAGDEEKREGRGRRRGRRSGRGRDRQEASASETAETTDAADVADAAEAANVAEAVEPAPRVPGRSRRKPAPAPAAVEAAEDEDVAAEDLADIAEEPQLRRSGAAPAPQRRGGPTGFGDHVPPFITRSVRERLTEMADAEA